MIYFITEKDTQEYIKIGFTDNIYNRLPQLQSSNPRELLLLGTVEGNKQFELELHRKFKHLKIKGEWFKYNNELKNYIRDLTANKKMNNEQYKYKDIVLDLILQKDSVILIYLKRLKDVKNMIKESKQYLLNYEYERLFNLYNQL